MNNEHLKAKLLRRPAILDCQFSIDLVLQTIRGLQFERNNSNLGSIISSVRRLTKFTTSGLVQLFPTFQLPHWRTSRSISPRSPSSSGSSAFWTKRLRASPSPKPTPKRTSKTPAPSSKATSNPSSPNGATGGYKRHWERSQPLSAEESHGIARETRHTCMAGRTRSFKQAIFATQITSSQSIRKPTARPDWPKAGSGQRELFASRSPQTSLRLQSWASMPASLIASLA